MAAPFILQCLGRPTLSDPEGRPVRFKTKKHLALLIYLAVEPRVPHRRERLSDLLWGSAELRAGRHSLATALSVLRARVGRAAFESGRDWVKFVGDELELDLDRLAAGEVLETELLPALEVGGFLEDFEIEDASGFDLWRDQQRARWQPTIRDALSRLIDRCRRTGDFGRIEAHADRLLRLDELSEEGIRAKMEARAFAGDRLTALKLYEEWQERLARELAATPSAILEGMALRLRRRGWEREDTKEIPPVPTDHWKGRAFVGRGAEYRTLYEAWESSRAGVPRHVLVLGDSGVGKSTVVGRLATAAGLEGAAVGRVQGHALEQKVPYAALTGLIEELIERPGASGTAPAALAELAETVVAVRERFPGLPAVPAAQGESARIRFSEGVEQLLRSVAEEQPVVLVVDDFHHVDDASAAVLHLLMRRLVGVPVMLVLAARTGELAALPNGQRVVENRARLYLSLQSLTPLTGEESVQLIDSLLPDGTPRPAGATRRALVRAAAGFPLALELLVRDWECHREHCLALSLQAMTEDLPHGVAPADAYRQVFERMYQGLHPLTRNVLNLAALLGSRLNDTRLFAIGDLTVGQTMAGLARLVELRVLCDDGRELVFVNELIRAQAYLGVPSPIRRTLHGTIADRLLADDRLGRSIPGLEVAWHLTRSGRGPEATPFLLRGAREAISKGAPNEAETALSSALTHLEEPSRSEAIVLCAQALQEQGRMSDSVKLLACTPPLATRDSATLADILQLEAKRICHPYADTAANVVGRALTAFRTSSSPSTRIRALSVAASALEQPHDQATVVSIATCISIADGLPLDERDRTLLAFAKATMYYHTLQRQECLEQLERGCAFVRDGNIADSLACRLFNDLGAARCAAGDFGGAGPDFHNAWRLCQRIGDSRLMASIATNIALCEGAFGRFAEQSEWATAALETGETPRPLTASRALFLRAMGHALSADPTGALAALSYGDSAILPAGNPHLNQDWILKKADVLLVLGDPESATENADMAIPLEEECNGIRRVGRYARWRARVGIRRNQPGSTQASLEALLRARTNYDAVDQLEILGAAAWFARQTKGEVPPETHSLWDDLAALPKGIGHQLTRLDTL